MHLSKQPKPPSRLFGRCCALLLISAFWIPGTRAHDGVHEQIDRVTRHLAESPESVQLYLKRAELLRLHGTFEASLEDVATAEKLEPGRAEYSLLRGRVAYDQEQWVLAVKHLQAYRKKSPNNGDAEVLLARTLGHLEQWARASAAYSRSLPLFKTPAPDLYLEQAESYLKHDPADRTRALECLNAGLARLGSIPSLEQRAVAMEVDSRQFDAALIRVDRLAAKSPRKERWLAWRGDILLAAGRSDEALMAYRNAHKAIESLGPRQRGTASTQSLFESVQAKISQLTKRESIR